MMIDFESAIRASDLSKNSQTQYVYRLRRILKLVDHDVDWVLRHPKEVYKRLRDEMPELQSSKAYINSVLAVFKYHDGGSLKTTLKSEYKLWIKAFKRVNTRVETRYAENKPTDTQIENFVEWKDIVKVRDGLDKTSFEYVLLCMLTMIPPCRAADMHRVRMYMNGTAPGRKERKTFPNYLVSNVGMTRMVLVYNQFKTKSDSMPTYSKELPPELSQVIRTSVIAKPREFLFVSPKNGKAFNNAHTFTALCNKTFKSLFDKGVTFNTLRHSYVTTGINMHELSLKEMESASADMMHSLRTHIKYKLLLPKKDTDDKLMDKSCVCECTPVMPAGS
jgi:hypothetical protein